MNLNTSFNRLIDYLPDTLERLSLSVGFNQKIEKLPKNLIYLSFRNGYYNQSIDNIIFPDNLKTIIFGKDFDQLIDALPDTIEHITLQKIIIINENQMKLFPKLPFGCKIEA